MTRYILRLDDASEYMDIEKWEMMERLLDKYHIKPIFGIIPNNKDESLIGKYERDPNFWDKVKCWESKGWTPAMHGYEHRYVTEEGGINPVNKRSEFAGLTLQEQEEKIVAGWSILIEHNFKPEIFFAPSHTFDENTLIAIERNTSIRVISDTIACDMYKKYNFWFIPQQSGSVRRLPFHLVTFCYHPNTMVEKSFTDLEMFLKRHQNSFTSYDKLTMNNRKENIIDKFLRKIYFYRR